TPADVDRLMSLVGDEVGLLFDSGHMMFAGGDAVAMLEKHVARVCHVHCKDVRPAVIKLARNRNWSFLEAVINDAFTVPGDGALSGMEIRRLCGLSFERGRFRYSTKASRRAVHQRSRRQSNREARQ